MLNKKNVQEQILMRLAGKILANVFRELESSVKIGASTKEIDLKAYTLILKEKCIPAFLNYNGFPATSCISINDEIVHGIPSAKRILKEGDIVSIDMGLIYNGYYSDMAKTFGLGKVTETEQKLIKVTADSLTDAVNQCYPNKRLGDVGCAVQKRVEANNFSVVRDYVGHGIGKKLHEDPQIFNFGKPNTGIKIEEGMVFAIEPMVNIGHWKTKVLKDGWTVVTKDGSKSAHFEHTVLITANGPEILTN